MNILVYGGDSATANKPWPSEEQVRFAESFGPMASCFVGRDCSNLEYTRGWIDAHQPGVMGLNLLARNMPFGFLDSEWPWSPEHERFFETLLSEQRYLHLIFFCGALFPLEAIDGDPEHGLIARTRPQCPDVLIRDVDAIVRFGDGIREIASNEILVPQVWPGEAIVEHHRSRPDLVGRIFTNITASDILGEA